MSIVFKIAAPYLKQAQELNAPALFQKVLFKVQYKNTAGLGLRFIFNLELPETNHKMAAYENKYFAFVNNYNQNKSTLAELGDYVVGSLQEIKPNSYIVSIGEDSTEGLFLKMCPNACGYMDNTKNYLICNYCTHNYKYTSTMVSNLYGCSIY